MSNRTDITVVPAAEGMPIGTEDVLDGPKWQWMKPAVALIFAAAFLQLMTLFTPAYIFPGWGGIAEALTELDYSYVAVSLVRIVVALCFSFVLATAIALLLYSVPALEGYVRPLVVVIMAVPALAWVMMAVLWFKSVEPRILFVLSIECCPIFMVTVLDGMKGIPRQWRDMVRAFRPSRLDYITKAIIPAVVPSILTSWRVCTSLSVRVVTIAELVGAVSGIGYGLFLSQQIFDTAAVYAWTLITVALLLLMTFGIQLLERRLLRWRHED